MAGSGDIRPTSPSRSVSASRQQRGNALRAMSHGGVADTYIVAAGYDPLVDEGITYTRRLDEDGVRVTHVRMADRLHAFLTMGWIIPASELAPRQAALSLLHHWAGC
ncbi:alpha/beta hydrolase fold domain-containing protein [Roseomonas sp. GCM10028921]